MEPTLGGFFEAVLVPDGTSNFEFNSEDSCDSES